MHHLILLAKEAVENYIKDGKTITPPNDLPSEFFTKKAGVFVSINTKYKIQNTKYELRGCIGTYLPTRINVAEEIIRNAIAAATEDYRFEPIKKEELHELSYTVYILSYPEPIKDIKELDPKKYGIIVKTIPLAYPDQNVVFNGHTIPKTGVLLPGLDEVDTVEQQLSVTCYKSKIDPAKEKIFIYRFTVEKYQ